MKSVTNKNKFVTKHNFMVCVVILVCIAIISYVDLVVRPSYFIKTAVKAPIFFLVPILYSIFYKDFKPFAFLKPKKDGLLFAFLLGIGIYIIVLGFYLIASSFADLSGVKISLENNLGINKNNLIYIGLYVSICNSFLEEWFFRGFVFHGFRKTSRKAAYLVSSLSFAVYHIAIMDGMFGFGILLLTLLGLFVGGTIFNYLNEKHRNIYASWFCHSFANFAMNTIGYLIFFT
ncbi:type II CAAX endopeptidase family protein [Chakrabartyella piscis]|uniref:CPBP family intramembrane glutamic endopeptidase n=1 Tax=Chakrabartyella piscis TaxID=2918914 RepID=UPI0029584912|nr:type II CAAX endopeptidase family protein [Chakrabartyella piscis]